MAQNYERFHTAGGPVKLNLLLTTKLNTRKGKHCWTSESLKMASQHRTKIPSLRKSISITSVPKKATAPGSAKFPFTISTSFKEGSNATRAKASKSSSVVGLGRTSIPTAPPPTVFDKSGRAVGTRSNERFSSFRNSRRSASVPSEVFHLSQKRQDQKFNSSTKMEEYFSGRARSHSSVRQTVANNKLRNPSSRNEQLTSVRISELKRGGHHVRSDHVNFGARGLFAERRNSSFPLSETQDSFQTVKGSHYGRKQRSAENIAVTGSNYVQGNYASAKMKAVRSEISLLDQKRLQWAKEKEELNGLWSPWGRQSESTPANTNTKENSTSEIMQTSYPPPSNVVSSSFVANLGIGSPTYSQPHSECYLPPINSTIAQQPRQKAKVWSNNSEFQQEDYRYENDPPHSHSHHNIPSNNSLHKQSVPNNRGIVHPRKASLPNYMFEGGDGYYNNNNYQHQQMILQQQSKLNNGGTPTWGGAVTMEEDVFTSDYYSGENNNNGDELGGAGGLSPSTKEIILKPTSRERSYQEEITVQKEIAIKKGDKSGSSPSRVVMHKIYSQNGEIFEEHEGLHSEVIVNGMTIKLSGAEGDSSGRSAYDSSRNPAGNNNLPRNHAMRSSLTIGVDASSVDAYYENDRREKEQWLNELEKQREEQRLRKMMEKEERRPRWGDRGIGVGHFWEPADSENSHLPAPPHKSKSQRNGAGGSLTRSESHAGGETRQYHHHHHPGQSHTPPAWLERSLTRMQSSKSQPSLHDPDYSNDLEYSFDVNDVKKSSAGEAHANQNLASSRSLNHSAIDLRNVAGYCSPTGDSDRTYLRGQNVPIDPDTLTEREKRRQANQEHLEALKKQIEERQQMQKEEKERRQLEEREQELRMAKQREMELLRLEMERRGRIPVNGDMPNSVEDAANTMETSAPDQHKTPSKISTMIERATIPLRDPSEEKDIEIVQRQSVMVVTSNPTEEEEKTGSSSASIETRQMRRMSRQDQSIMTDTSDPMCERILTPTTQRSRSLSLCRSSREFGTQTELSDGSTSSGTSSCESGKNSNKNRSHNSLLDKKAKEKKQLERKKSEERPRWGSNPVKKQYIKQSEKDPNYISRMKRRQERLKRMEEERSARGDTGTESEDVHIPFHRIRQRRHDLSVTPKKVKGIAPLKAITSFLGGKTEKRKEAGNSTSLATLPQQNQDETVPVVRSNKGRWKATENEGKSENERLPRNQPSSHTMKPAKSESHLSQQQAAEIIDKNFGSVAGIHVAGTSEESSGFSSPFLPRRDHLGSGSTESGSGTTGSGSGVQSPDLAYHSHAYQVVKSNREEMKYTQITSGRDTHAISSKSGERNVVKHTRREFSSPHKGFIHQEDFDEMPVNSSKTQSKAEGDKSITVARKESIESEIREIKTKKTSSVALRRSRQRNKSISPTRRLKSPTKANIVRDSKNKSKSPEYPEVPPAMLPPLGAHGEDVQLPDMVTNSSARPTSPPVPALLKKMQMGLQPDESGRISSLPTEFPDILAPLPAIPIRLVSPINLPSSRLSSATSGSGASSTSAGKIDIDIAVTPRRNPQIIKLFEAAEERIKQRQMTAIMTTRSKGTGNDSGKSRRSFEADIGNISINLEPVSLYPNGMDDDEDDIGIEKFELEIPAMSSARLSIRSHQSTPSRPPETARSSETARHEAFIASILNSKEVKDQLSARESELSEKGIIEFSIRLPSNSSGDEYLEEYKDPLLTERRRHTAQWLYGSQNQSPQKQSIFTNLASLKKGLSLQESEWKPNDSDTE